MGRVISVTNQKGGVGKTTTCINLSACLAQAGKKVLTIDADPQGNTSSGLGIQKDILTKTLYNLLLGEIYIEQVIHNTIVDNLFVIPSNMNLAGAEIELVGMENREYILKKIIDNTKFLYDFILIDCPPSLNLLTINALTASDSVLVPIQCEYFALEGLTQLLHTVSLVQKRLNPHLEMEGVVFTMYDARTNLSLQVIEEVKKHLPNNVYRSIIPRNVRLSEAPSHGLPITMYDEKSKGAESYILLAEEVMERRK
ncbi:MAG: AAA family ATPase [Defluviitaleaceae bacterium]|nr:AAA family ATPase [Defluviitaleaceae bacterium]